MVIQRSNRFTSIEKSWILYDWANSVYAIIIMAAIYPIYFTGVMANSGGNGDIWWGYATSAATLVTAILAPFLGAIGDFRGMKKRLFSVFLILGVVFTTVMGLTDNWQMMLVGYVFSYIGFAGSLLFYDSFLTDITTADRMDRVSAWGYSMGYLGGSTIPFIVSIALVLFGDKIGVDSVLAVKLSCVLTSIWWAAFSIPFLRNVHQTHYEDKPARALIAGSLRNIGRTVRDILHSKAILVFMIAYFFYIDGVNTVIHMATAYGSSLGLGSTGMILALMVTQLVAVPFSILFSRLSGKIGSIRMISIAIVVYFFICTVGFYMGYSVEQAQAAFARDFNEAAQATAMQRANILFWAMAVLVGTCQGGIQALSRSFFGKLIPPSRSNEFYGFFDIFGKFAAVIGPALYALVANLTGRSSYGILSLMLLFAIGLLTIVFGRKHLQQAEFQASEAVRRSREDAG
ncbi:MAG TPA: MFS transporter [Clostridiales bacterium]|nr:MFS transporter [Clostridiales bacterium]